MNMCHNNDGQQKRVIEFVWESWQPKWIMVVNGGVA
jgi:hypothetical protein